jgi:hypothetical protein
VRMGDQLTNQSFGDPQRTENAPISEDWVLA